MDEFRSNIKEDTLIIEFETVGKTLDDWAEAIVQINRICIMLLICEQWESIPYRYRWLYIIKRRFNYLSFAKDIGIENIPEVVRLNHESPFFIELDSESIRLLIELGILLKTAVDTGIVLHRSKIIDRILREKNIPKKIFYYAKRELYKSIHNLARRFFIVYNVKSKKDLINMEIKDFIRFYEETKPKW